MSLIQLIFLSVPGLDSKYVKKNTEEKLELLTDIDILLMVKKGIRGAICDAIHRYATANNKCLKNVKKTMNHHILCTLMQIICMDGQCLKKYL